MLCEATKKHNVQLLNVDQSESLLLGFSLKKIREPENELIRGKIFLLYVKSSEWKPINIE